MGSLSELLWGKNQAQLPDQKWNDRRKVQILSDIINGVGFLHCKKVLHRDLKSMNILYAHLSPLNLPATDRASVLLLLNELKFHHIRCPPCGTLLSS